MARVFLRCGHYTHDAAFGGKPLDCPWGCGKQERDPVESGFTADIFGDPVQEHYNHSLGQVVRSRAHLKRFQRTEGTTDYVPTPRTAESLARLKRNRGIS